MASFDESLLRYIQSLVLIQTITQKQFAEIAKKLYLGTIKSVVENDIFVIYKYIDDKWIRYAHKDLALNEIRTTLASYVDKARYTINVPAIDDFNYAYKIKQWQQSILKLLDLHDQLHDYTFMKCILEEFILLVYQA
jgi:hypothetical protein